MTRATPRPTARPTLTRRTVLLDAVGALPGTVAATEAAAYLNPRMPLAAEAFGSVHNYPAVPPVRLRIPAESAMITPLQRLDRGPDGTVEAPADSAVIGWFAVGPRPDPAGPAVVLGHVDSASGPGVFYPRAGLKPGAGLAVQRAGGSSGGFRVTGAQHVPKTGFPTQQMYGAALEPPLRAGTCDVRFDRARGSYDDNVSLNAELAR
jgi:hypothetical protein